VATLWSPTFVEQTEANTEANEEMTDIARTDRRPKGSS
jgi:hypothetical protein